MNFTWFSNYFFINVLWEDFSWDAVILKSGIFIGKKATTRPTIFVQLSLEGTWTFDVSIFIFLKENQRNRREVGRTPTTKQVGFVYVVWGMFQFSHWRVFISIATNDDTLSRSLDGWMDGQAFRINHDWIPVVAVKDKCEVNYQHFQLLALRRKRWDSDSLPLWGQVTGASLWRSLIVGSWQARHSPPTDHAFSLHSFREIDGK